MSRAVDGQSVVALSDAAFDAFRDLMARVTGIHLAPAKKAMVAGRLASRLRHHGLDDYDGYRRLLARSIEEQQAAIDLLTTNETHFFREGRHFDLLRERIIPALPRFRPARVWSAAASTGQEAYSAAMVLADRAANPLWEVIGSDVSRRVLEQARQGRYPMQQAREIPDAYRRRYCLRGVGTQEGGFIVDAELRRRVRFMQINLNQPLPSIGMFDVVLLRNVLIYFPAETKQQVVGRVTEMLRPGGWLLVGHSEALGPQPGGLQSIAPSVYVRQ